MTTLGEAFIEVHADTRPFARELGAQIKAILKSVDAKVSPEAVGLGESIAKGVAEGVDRDSDKIRQIIDGLGAEAATPKPDASPHLVRDNER